MRYIFFVLAAILFTFSAVRFYRKRAAATAEQQAHADHKPTTVKLYKSLIDVGQKKVHAVVDAKFVLYNTGKNDLYIENVLPDCHCTAADFSTKAILPNDSTVITLKYNASQPGVFQSSAVVTTNSIEPNILLIFRGSVEP
jgi:hypothetical protein